MRSENAEATLIQDGDEFHAPLRQVWSWAFLGRALQSDSAALAAANLATAFIGIITGVVTARVLGPERRGDLAVITFWPALLAMMGELGIGDALTLIVSRTRASSASAFRHAGALALGATTATLAIGVPLLSVALTRDQVYLLPRATQYLCGFTIASFVGALPSAVLLGLGEYRAVALTRVATAFMYLAACIAAVLASSANVETFMWLTVASRAFPAVALVPYALRRVQRTSEVRALSMAGTGVRLQAARAPAIVAGMQDRALANWFLPMTGIGYWQVAAAVGAVMPFISQALAQETFSKYGCTRESDRSRLVRAQLQRAVVFTAAAAAGAALVLPVAIPLAYSERFIPAVAPAMVMLASAVPGAAALVLQAVARARIKVADCIASEILAIVTSVFFAFALARGGSMVGLAASVCLGRTAASLWFLFRSRAALGTCAHDLITWQWIPRRQNL